MKNEEIINDFLVEMFNNILIEEELELEKVSSGELSIKEIHVIESVFKQENLNINTMSDISKTLRITAGSLTTSVITLERKGYLKRVKDETDKRVVKIITTSKAKQVNEAHVQYHKNLAEAVCRKMNFLEKSTLIKMLSNLNDFFKIKS